MRPFMFGHKPEVLFTHSQVSLLVSKTVAHGYDLAEPAQGKPGCDLFCIMRRIAVRGALIADRVYVTILFFVDE